MRVRVCVRVGVVFESMYIYRYIYVYGVGGVIESMYIYMQHIITYQYRTVIITRGPQLATLRERRKVPKPGTTCFCVGCLVFEGAGSL